MAKREREDRLKELSELEDGWCNGHGKAPSPQSIESARLINSLLPDCAISPTEDGGIQIEWVYQEDFLYDQSIEILPNGNIGFVASMKCPRHNSQYAIQ